MEVVFFLRLNRLVQSYAGQIANVRETIAQQNVSSVAKEQRWDFSSLIK